MRYKLTDKGEHIAYATCDALAGGAVKATSLLGSILTLLIDKPLSLRELDTILEEPEGNILRELDWASKQALIIQVP
jgi:hypothetical protein